MVAVVVAVDAWRDRERARSLVDPAILAFLVVGSFWYVLGALHWGDRFLVKHVLGENFRHFFGSLVVEEKPVRGLLHHLSHFVNVFTGTLPWGFLLPFAFLEKRPGADRRGTAALWRWLVAGFVFFTLATRKSPYYLLPIFPPLALVVGGWLWHRIELERSAPSDVRAWLPWSLGGVLTGIVALLGWHLAGAPGLDADRLAALRALVESAPVLWLGVIVAAAALGVAIGAAVRRRAREFVIASLLAGLALSEVGNAIEIPLARVQSLRRFALDAAARVDEATPVYFFELPLPAIALYAERTIPTLRGGDARAAGRFALIVPESLAERMPEEWRAGSRVLLEDRARVFTRRPMQIRLLEVVVAAGGRGEEASPTAADGAG